MPTSPSFVDMRQGGGLPLEVRGVTITVPGGSTAPRTLLSVPHWSIGSGARVALCGPSGSGKTSLLNVLSALARPAAGTVHWGAIDVTWLSPVAADRWRRATVGLVFQHFHLFAGLSALENVVVSARFDRLFLPAKIVDHARELLDAVQVPAKNRIETLSSGEMQRVAIARALSHSPAIVLADEPTASLDRHTADTAIELLVDLCAKNQATLVVATHDAALASRMQDRFDITDGQIRAASATA
jgi:putative ABC transport system ATP-binding protein